MSDTIVILSVSEGSIARHDATVGLGCRDTDAFWDEDQKATLLRDAGGNWYLAVPRGGGVLLAVKLKKIERVTASALRAAWRRNFTVVSGKTRNLAILATGHSRK